MVERVQLRASYLVDSDGRLDAILDVAGARREDLGEFLGHVGVLDGALQVPEHLAGELARAVDRTAACVLAEQVADVVDQILPSCVIAAGSDSHGCHFAHWTLKAVLLG